LGSFFCSSFFGSSFLVSSFFGAIEPNKESDSLKSESLFISCFFGSSFLGSSFFGSSFLVCSFFDSDVIELNRVSDSPKIGSLLTASCFFAGCLGCSKSESVVPKRESCFLASGSFFVGLSNKESPNRVVVSFLDTCFFGSSGLVSFFALPKIVSPSSPNNREFLSSCFLTSCFLVSSFFGSSFLVSSFFGSACFCSGFLVDPKNVSESSPNKPVGSAATEFFFGSLGGCFLGGGTSPKRESASPPNKDRGSLFFC